MADNYVRSKRHPELFRKGGPIWWAFIPNPQGGRKLRVSTGHADEGAAHLWYLGRIRERPVSAASDETTLYDALTRRVSERATAGRSADTLDFYAVKGRQLQRVLGKDTRISSIDARAVDAYVAQRLRGDDQADPVERSTIHKELVTLRGALKLARRQGYAVRPVEEVMPLDFSPKYKPRERALSEREIDMLIGALPPVRGATIAFIVATGATYPSETVSLRKGDVDQKTWIVHLRGTKRETRDRFVPVVSFARRWLKMALEYLPLPRWSNVRRDMHDACELAGIAKCSPNDLRRSIATLMRARGVPPHILAAYLGHKDSRMAERVYGRLSPAQLQHLLEQHVRAAPSRRRAG